MSTAQIPRGNRMRANSHHLCSLRTTSHPLGSRESSLLATTIEQLPLLFTQISINFLEGNLIQIVLDSGWCWSSRTLVVGGVSVLDPGKHQPELLLFNWSPVDYCELFPETVFGSNKLERDHGEGRERNSSAARTSCYCCYHQRVDKEITQHRTNNSNPTTYGRSRQNVSVSLLALEYMELGLINDSSGISFDTLCFCCYCAAQLLFGESDVTTR